MSEYIETVSTEDANAVIDSKLRKVFDGRIVRKDLTKKIKEGANVPVYVLEFLLGQYCSSDDEDVIETGVANVKRILAENYVRPDEAQKILSVLRQRGSYTVIARSRLISTLRRTAMRRSFPISESKQFLSLRITRLNTIGFSAAVSGALSSLNMNMWKRISADPQYSFISSRLFRCLMWTLRN